MNRLICRRLTVNVFWASIYSGLVLYVCLINYYSKELSEEVKLNQNDTTAP